MERILVNCSPRETRVASLEESEIRDIWLERECACGYVGNVYLGKVVRVLPGMQSAFVDIGLDRTAFLHVADVEAAYADNGTLTPIEKILHEGEAHNNDFLGRQKTGLLAKGCAHRRFAAH